ncbi:MAG TPA: HAMP domain-containing protein [Polyangiaceae bacterium]
MSDVPHGRSGAPSLGKRLVSIGWKLGFAVFVVVTAAMAVAFFHFTAREKDGLVDAKRQAAEMVADLFAASLRAPLDFRDEDAVKSELENLRQNRDVTEAAVWLADREAPIGRIGAAEKVRPDARIRQRTEILDDRVRVIREVDGSEGKAVGSAIIDFSLARENAAFVESRNHILWLCMAVALGTMGMLLVFTKGLVVSPIEALLQAVRRLERGEHGIQVAVTHRDEIGRLARAFEAMDSAILDREKRLADAHESLRELFDHMRQAILVFDREGRVRGAQSREATSVFGREDLKGSEIRKLLYPEAGAWDAELRAFDQWMALAFDAGAEAWSEVSRLAPPSVRLGKGDAERVLTLEFRPITSDGVVQRIMLLCTDDTEKSRLERAVVVQGERHARQMAAMRRLVSGGGQQFVSFLEATRERLVRCREVAGERKELAQDELNECFGHVHTLRGEARIFGLDELCAWAERAEERLSEARARGLAEKAARVSLEGSSLASDIEEANVLVNDAERLFVDASPSGRAVLEQVTVRRPDLLRLCELARTTGGEAGALAERLSARSLGEITAPLGERASSWAESVNKRARVEVEGREVLVPERLARVLAGALTHLVRNAVAHGIEMPEERERAGKPEVALIRIGAIPGSGAALTPTVYVEDDGRGIAGNPLLASAAPRVLKPSDGADGSFRPGPPSLADELSGRGMGLSAVVRDLETVGFVLRVAPRASGGTRFSVEPDGARRPESGMRA